MQLSAADKNTEAVYSATMCVIRSRAKAYHLCAGKGKLMGRQSTRQVRLYLTSTGIPCSICTSICCLMGTDASGTAQLDSLELHRSTKALCCSLQPCQHGVMLIVLSLCMLRQRAICNGLWTKCSMCTHACTRIAVFACPLEHEMHRVMKSYSTSLGSLPVLHPVAV